MTVQNKLLIYKNPWLWNITPTKAITDSSVLDGTTIEEKGNATTTATVNNKSSINRTLVRK